MISLYVATCISSHSSAGRAPSKGLLLSHTDGKDVVEQGWAIHRTMTHASASTDGEVNWAR